MPRSKNVIYKYSYGIETYSSKILSLWKVLNIENVIDQRNTTATKTAITAHLFKRKWSK